MNSHDIALQITALRRPHPIRVGIDGFCASGKTTLADALEVILHDLGHSVIRACGDDFQNPPDIRYQLGKQSPEGFFRYAMDFASMRRELLDPLGPDGTLAYRISTYDVRAAQPNLSIQRRARSRDILLFDGLFLHVNELSGCFDFTIFLDIDYETCIARALRRGKGRFPDGGGLESHYRNRYVPGFALYTAEVHPQEKASLRV